MAELFKNLYSKEFYNNFSEVLGEVILSFDKDRFIKSIYTGDWDTKELKGRMRHTAIVLHDFLPADFGEGSDKIIEIINKLRELGYNNMALEFMFFPEYIERYGIDDFDTSVKLIEFVTQFTSCEFAVRPFILKYEDKMIKQMLRWSTHESEMVRRLASEGCRPRLPWAMALPALKADPTPILPILENLKNDPSQWVRKSVANNLNDISKDNPELTLAIAHNWRGISKETDKIIKHACRTLLKQGHPEILQYYGLHDSGDITLSDFKIVTSVVKIEEDLIFSFRLTNNEKQMRTVRIEYGLYFVRQNNKLSKKVFKISERQINAGESIDILKKHSFKLITTRRYYPGEHKLSVIINGEEREIKDFTLVE